MNIDDFYKMVESYGKRPGEYTEDEVVYIGSIYRLLVDRKDKSWEQLVDVLGTSLSPEALRKRTFRFLEMNPKIEKNIIKEYGSKKESLIPIRGRLSDLDAKLEDVYIQQTKARDILNEYRKNLREEARIGVLKESIQEAARLVETYVSKQWSGESSNSDPVEAVLLLSDWHIGASVENFYNRFNSKIADEDLDNICDQVINYCNSFGVDKLNILNMGDLIHGGIHTDSRIEQEFDVITQVEVAGQLLYKLLAKLDGVAPTVTYRSCSDNHSRLMANKSEHIEKENFGRLIDWWVEAKLEQGNHYIKVERDNLDYGLGKFDLLNGKKVMFAHGHEDPINQAYQNFTGATREFIDYILLGHFHNPKEKAFQDCKVIVNGSLVGTEQYALSKRLFSSPCQKLLIFDGNFVDISLQVESRV